MNRDNPTATWRTTSASETHALGRVIGERLIGGITIGLVGPLGAGKTQLVKGIAAGNGFDDPDQVTSPTYTLVHQYGGNLALFHLDAYRLTKPSELEALGFDEMVRSDTAVVVEWADRVEPIMPDDSLWIAMNPTGDTERNIEARANGSLSARLFDSLRDALR